MKKKTIENTHKICKIFLERHIKGKLMGTPTTLYTWKNNMKIHFLLRLIVA
jgi:hypothetical protein